MALLKDPNKLWFNTPDTNTLCRAGGNGPEHPTHLYLLNKYAKPGMSLLDIGCGSAATYEAIEKAKLNIWYVGVDMIPKNVAWCKETFPKAMFYEGDAEKLPFADRYFDIAYSRHVIDHMPSFEKAMDEHCRVADKLVLVTLWVPFSNQEEHEIKPIVDHRGTPEERTYTQEFTNQYSRTKVMDYFDSIKKDWKLLELTENVGAEVRGHDIAIALERI
jgi:ubiquinone/menaquinone biosynthesis C-methylase UbiE